MQNGIRIVALDKVPHAVQEFFEQLQGETVIVEHAGEAICVVYPSRNLTDQAARQALDEAKGGWTAVPDDIAEQIAAGNR